MRERHAARMYKRELLGSLGLYSIILFLAISYGRPMEHGILRTLLLVSPMLGFGVALWAVIRHFGRMDEYVRRLQLENIGLAAALTAGLSFTYGFLESAGFPRISMFWVWPVMGASWFMANLLRCSWAR